MHHNFRYATTAWVLITLLCSHSRADNGASWVVVPDVTLTCVDAVGDTACGFTAHEAVRWTRAGGLEVLPRLAGYEASAMNPRACGISWDGKIICGTTKGAAPRVAWTVCD